MLSLCVSAQALLAGVRIVYKHIGLTLMIAVTIIANISYTLMEYQALSLGFDYINSLILTTPIILTLRWEGLP